MRLFAYGVLNRELAKGRAAELIAPLEDTIGGKEVLLTQVSGALTALPLGLLVTSDPEGRDE